jgi:hypothetical protein
MIMQSRAINQHVLSAKSKESGPIELMRIQVATDINAKSKKNLKLQ